MKLPPTQVGQEFKFLTLTVGHAVLSSVTATHNIFLLPSPLCTSFMQIGNDLFIFTPYRTINDKAVKKCGFAVSSLKCLMVNGAAFHAASESIEMWPGSVSHKGFFRAGKQFGEDRPRFQILSRVLGRKAERVSEWGFSEHCCCVHLWLCSGTDIAGE